MGESPYRIGARGSARMDGAPRVASLSLVVGAFALASCGLAWVINRIASALDLHAQFGVVRYELAIPLAPYTHFVDAAFLATTALCSWRPIPGTRSHVFGRVALTAYFVLFALGFCPVSVADFYGTTTWCQPAIVVALAELARLVAFLAIALVPLEAMRHYATSRWPSIVGAAFAAAFFGSSGLFRVFRDYPTLAPARAGADVGQLLVFASIAGGFAFAARSIRSSPPLHAVATNPQAREIAEAETWRRRGAGPLGATSLFAVACFSGESVAALFVQAPSLSDGIIVTSSFASILGSLVLFVVALRAHRAVPDVAGLLAEVAAIGACLASAASAFMRFRHELDLAMGLRQVSVYVFCVALFAATVRIFRSAPCSVGIRKFAALMTLAAVALALGFGTFTRTVERTDRCGTVHSFDVNRVPVRVCFVDTIALLLAIAAIRRLDRFDAHARLTAASGRGSLP